MNIIKKDLRKILEQTLDLVKEVEKLINSNIGGSFEIKHKGEIDLVTEIDIKVEKELKLGLKNILDVDFLAEESSSNYKLGSEPVWIIDPIDGTTNFAHGIPMVATSIALSIKGEIVLGIINLPVIGELFYSLKGEGAYLNSKPIKVSSISLLSHSLIATGFPYDIKNRMQEIIWRMEAVLISSQGIRRMGAAAIDLAYVACGRFDGFYEQGLKPWDVAAGWLLVEEAGGRVSEYSENKSFSLYSPNILATNGKIHSQLSRLIDSKKSESHFR
jgi:myo-inositol-1(or 4)-monophosphatase